MTKIKWTRKKMRPEDIIREEVERRLEIMELRKPRRPTREDGKPLNPRLPTDLTMLSDSALGRLYTHYSIMAQWAGLWLARYGAEGKIAHQMEKRMRAEFRIRQEGTVSDKNDATESNPEIQAVIQSGLVDEVSEHLTQGYLNQYVIGREACSRELTRRQSIGNSGELRR